MGFHSNHEMLVNFKMEVVVVLPLAILSNVLVLVNQIVER